MRSKQTSKRTRQPKAPAQKDQVPKSNSKKKSQPAQNTPNLWSEVSDGYQNPNTNAPFYEFTGIKRPAASAETPIEFFQLFMTDDILLRMSLETNRYYKQLNAQKPSPMKWIDTTIEEIKAFLGVSIAIGLVNLPELDDYWRSGSIYGMPWFSSIFTRDRFKQILRYLHVVDNEKDLPKDNPDRDRLHKLGKLQDTLSKSFSAMYAPQRELSIDEQMIGTKSRVSFIQYMPLKPKKFGIKIWALCESISGYCLQFQIYTGKTDGNTENGLTYRVIFDLLRDYLGKGYKVYFDNFYTSFKLVDDLQKRQTYACGTLRKGRAEFSNEYKSEILKVGELHYLVRDNVIAVHWKDKRDVFALSSHHAPGETVIKRFSGDIAKPNLICDYNQFMGGVDKCDQYLSYYAIARKSSKWWKKVFFRLVELCVINSMCLYNAKFPKFASKRSSHKRFREILLHELVQPFLDKCEDDRLAGRYAIKDDPLARRGTTPQARLQGKHYSSIHADRRKCTVCAYKINPNTGKRFDKKTKTFCAKCDKHMCQRCFSHFHTSSNLKKKFF